MPGIDASRPFTPLRLAILTVSDTRVLDNDTSGAALVERATTAGHTIVARDIVPDDPARIESVVRAWLERADVDIVLATGGTGITARDVTPDVFARIYDKEIPGFGELFRWLSYASIGTSTIQSRASGGVARSKLLFCLPGSTGACRDAWDQILAQQLDNRYRPCNFAELLPRLK